MKYRISNSGAVFIILLALAGCGKQPANIMENKPVKEVETNVQEVETDVQESIDSKKVKKILEETQNDTIGEVKEETKKEESTNVYNKIEPTREYKLLQEDMNNIYKILKEHGCILDEENKEWVMSEPDSFTFVLNDTAGGLCGEPLGKNEDGWEMYNCTFNIESLNEINVNDTDGNRTIDHGSSEVVLKLDAMGLYDAEFSTNGELTVSGINAYEHDKLNIKASDDENCSTHIIWGNLGITGEVHSNNVTEHLYSFVDDSGNPIEITIPNAQFTRVDFYGHEITVEVNDGYDIESYKGDVNNIKIKYNGKEDVIDFPELNGCATADSEPYINHIVIGAYRYGDKKGTFELLEANDQKERMEVDG